MKPTKGESANKRQTRSIHEKQRRIEMNTVLSEMFDLLSSDDEKPTLPKKPDKCWIIGQGVDMIRAHRREMATPIANPEHFSDFFLHSNSEVAIFEIRDFMVVRMMGDASTIFGVEKTRMIGKDIRSFLDFDSGVNFKLGEQKVWCSIIGRRFSASWQNNLLICFAEPPSKLAEQRPLLAAMLSTTSTLTPTPTIITPTNPSTHQQPPDLDITANTTITPSLHCDDTTLSSSSAFLSPQSSSSESKSRKSRRTRKRLRSVNVIVETYELDATKSSSLSATVAAPPQLQIPALISPIPTPLNPYEVLTPGYRDIWLRLQSERLLLEQRVMAKERELQNLMMATYSNPP